MKKPPRPDRRARTDSSIGDRKARAARVTALTGRLAAPNDSLRVRFRELFSNADLRRAAGIIAALRHDWHAANIASGNDVAAWDANALRHRRRVARDLARSLPGYREWKALQRKSRREREQAQTRSIALLMPDANVHLDTDDIPTDLGAFQPFTPPFPVHEVFNDLALDTSLDLRDQSFVVPGIGHIINDLEYTFSDDGDFEEAFGINVRARSLAWAGCGIDLRVPADGHLKLSARMRNFYNSASMSIRDQVGFSESDLKLKICLYLDILHVDSPPEYAEVLERQKHLTSGGGERHYVMPELSTDEDYLIETTSTRVYGAGQHVQILAGCRVLFDSTIDDMTTHARVLLWWQLKELTLEVIPHVIL